MASEQEKFFSTGTRAQEKAAAMRAVSEFCIQKIKTATGEMVRCGTRNAYWCPGCARLYAIRWRQIAESGIFDVHGRPLKGVAFVFLTLTLPSFGRVHQYVKPRKRASMKASNRCCRFWHEKHDSRIGFPVDVENYDWRLAILTNEVAGTLFDKLMTAIKRAFGKECSRFSVIELQARGSRHYHLLLRVPEERFDLEKLKTVLARRRSVTTWQGDVIELGSMTDVRVLNGESLRRKRGPGKRKEDPLGYMVKHAGYLFKSINAVTTKPTEMSVRLHRYARNEYRCGEGCIPNECMQSVHENPVDPREPFGKDRLWSLTGLTVSALKQKSRDWMVAQASADSDCALSAEAQEELEEIRAKEQSDASGRFVHRRYHLFGAYERERKALIRGQARRIVREPGANYDVHGERI